MTLLSLSRLSPKSDQSSLLCRLIQYRALAKGRRALRQLDADQLSDIGITAKDARIEGSRAFWDAPSTWRN